MMLRFAIVMVLSSCGTGGTEPRTSPPTPDVQEEIAAPEERAPAPLERTLTIEPMSACWLRPDARIACWGRLSAGVYGAEPFSAGPADRPMRLANEPWPDPPRMLAGFGERRCAVTRSGRVRCWGHILLSEAHLFMREPPGDAIAMAPTGSFGDREPCVLTRSGLQCFSRAPEYAWVHIEGSEGADALATTDSLICVRKRNGRVHCGGDGGLAVVEGPANVEEISTCGERVCARETGGRLWNVRRAYSGDPLSVERTGVEDASALRGHCVLRSGGLVSCLHRGTFTEVRGIANVESIAVGGSAVCAPHEGQALCATFGRGATLSARPMPALEGVRAIAPLGDGACAILDDDVVRCVRIADGRSMGPQDLRATEIVATGTELCALYAGRVHCVRGEQRYSPRVDGIVALERLDRHVCGRRASGERHCFSDYAIAELVPEGGTVPGIESAREVTVGAGFACALGMDGTVRCWGVHGEHGQLGDGRSRWSTDPVRVSGIDDAIDIDAGDSTACAVRANGRVSCWGIVPDNTGIASGDQPVPLEMGELEDVAEVAVSLARGGAICARHTDGSVSCRGGRFHCDLPERHQPLTEAARIPEIASARRIEGGAGHWCALLEAARVACWGMTTQAYDPHRECGAPPSTFDLLGARDLALDGAWTCVDRGAHGVSCWGREVPFHDDGTFTTPTTLFSP